MSDDVLSYKIASIVYHQAVQTIPSKFLKLLLNIIFLFPDDVEFRLSFLNVLLLFKNVTEREEEIIKK